MENTSTFDPEIKVLDHGHVRLVESMGSDLSVVRAARVSYAAEWRAGEDDGKDAKLIGYLMRNRHTSPFEAVTLTFDLKMPVFVARQWHRHRTWSYNEVSARYTELPEEVYVPDVEQVGVQSQSNKQGRDRLDLDVEATDMRLAEIMAVEAHHSHAFTLYRELLKSGWPRELARTVLPVATYTHFFGTVNLHNLFAFLRLRLHPHAQYEIRVYAEALLKLAAGVAPVSAAAFKETL